MLKNIANLEKLSSKGSILLAFANEIKIVKILERVLAEQQFLSPYGVRSVSKIHAQHPFTINLGGQIFTLDYEPGRVHNGDFRRELQLAGTRMVST